VSLQPFEQLSDMENRWERRLSSPVWYLTTIPEIQKLTESLRSEAPELQDAVKARLYDFFELHLREGDISLGRKSAVMDIERKEIDTIVIHHTSNPPGLRFDRLSAIELIRLYGPYFENPRSDGDKHLKGQPIYSGHVRCGKQVFWPYHWIVRHDGRVERLLYDSEVGWHAGNWEVNCRSIAIVLDNDYELDRPSKIELSGIARLIRSRYPNIPPTKILGHQEVNSNTTCPSRFFLNSGEGKGWKDDLVSLLQ
jgi:hypothetical protein